MSEGTLLIGKSPRRPFCPREMTGGLSAHALLSLFHFLERGPTEVPNFFVLFIYFYFNALMQGKTKMGKGYCL
jgi:hypothetical protein